jgi:DNA-binding NtrC family response regulator
MTNAVLVVQKTDSQNEIWGQLLRSQGLITITESPQVDIRKLITEASQSHQELPRLIILEMSIEKLNPYDFCRWIQEHYPSLKVILTAQQRIQVSDIEQRWARNQGAYELLAGFDYSNLSASLTKAMELVMLALGRKDWEQEHLVPVIEALNEQFSQVGEPKTLIQESETFIQPTVSESEDQKLASVTQLPTRENKLKGLKVKPKVKRFRGLPY